MSIESNYDDILSQLKGAGLLVDSLEVGRMMRCRVEGEDREKRGWYMLHELRLHSGDTVLVGSYGVWRGNENNAIKIELKSAELTQDQRDALKRRLAEDRKKADALRAAQNRRAAEQARKAWAACKADGDCDYLHRKSVGAHGVRFSPHGAMVIPMCDVGMQIHGLQIIRSKEAVKAGRKLEKEFWPAGLAKRGHFHLLGLPSDLVLVCEGYATGATLFEATGLPVAIAFDAGNLQPVAEALHRRFKRARILICADDDAFSTGNPGVTAASAAALAVGGAFVAPTFADEPARRLAFEAKGQKISDFNDLHALEGLHVVKQQVASKLTAMGWDKAPSRVPTATGGEGSAAADAGAGPTDIRPIESLDEILPRYCLVYGQGGTVFDQAEHRLVSLGDMRDLCLRRELHRAWMEHPQRRIVRVEEVGFDPACTDKNIKCNLWSGWPTQPKAGNCHALLDLLHYMCGNESNGQRLYTWVLRWLAYPIQHPGAKMRTCLVIHGPQGTGKNLFFESVMDIYGPYGRIVDQSAIEDKFNDWASRKLFLIADEVIARSDLYHVKNKLKAFITGDWIRINPKNLSAYEERNHVNMVFLSNEAQPVVLEEDDRRHAVIWTPEKLSPEFYADVRKELANGGAAALHDYLLNLDLGDFNPGTAPPDTQARRDLIDMSLDSPARFLHAFNGGDVEGFPALNKPAVLTPCYSTDMYDLYCEWSRRQGLKTLADFKFKSILTKKFGGVVDRKRVGVGSNPTRVIHMPGGHTLPAGRSESDWLQERCDVFRQTLRDFRGQQAGGFA